MIFGSEPVLDMMELSGYAMLMSELEPPGIWPEVHTLWDGILSGDTAPAIAKYMSAVLSAHESLFALTPGSIGRTERKMALARLMSERGITGRMSMRGDGPPPDNVIVGVFAPLHLGGSMHDLADLFIVEYLRRRPDMAGPEISRRAEMLQDSLDHYRIWMTETRDASQPSEEA